MKRMITLAATALLFVGGFALWQSTQTQYPTLQGMAEAQAADADTSMVQEMTLGSDDAPVTVIEYASFTCPHCKNFHQGVFNDLKANYIDTGKVKFIYREVYFDRFGLWAGMVARCGAKPAEANGMSENEAASGTPATAPATVAEPDPATRRYFAIADLIYEQQADWTKGENPRAIAENLAKIGRTAGLAAEEIDACLQDSDKAQAMVALYQKNAERDDIRSTPTFLIDGEKFSNMSYDKFAEILDGKLGN